MKAVVFTLGCKVNSCESASLMRGLEELGYEVSEELSFADLYIINTCAVTKEADNAVRVMVIKNGEETVYAKSQKGSTEPEPDTEPFFSDTQVLSDITDRFEPGEVDKYTVVIWLEGNDPECVDDIRGGVVKMSMTFKVLEKLGGDT